MDRSYKYINTEFYKMQGIFMEQKENKKSLRFFWLKLEENFFKDPKIKKLRKLPGGDTLALIYLELMLLSIENNGILVYEGLEDSFEAELSLKIDEDEDSILIVLNFLRQYNLLIEIENASTFSLTQNNWSIGSETQSARYKRNAKNNEIGNFPPNFHQISEKIGNVKKKEKKQKKKEEELELELELEKELDTATTTQARAREELKYQCVRAKDGGAYLFISDNQIEALYSNYSQETLGYYLNKMNELSMNGYKHGCSDYEYIIQLIKEDRRT